MCLFFVSVSVRDGLGCVCGGHVHLLELILPSSGSGKSSITVLLDICT
jgi:hypothetical protein